MGNTLDIGRKQYEVSDRVIQTSFGPIKGKKMYTVGDKVVEAFLKVPFAKPPVGELRFKKPVDPEPWTEVLQTTEWAPRGIQNDPIFVTKWKYGATSEDSLYLNVFAPAWAPPEGGFPVMVFIHGGGFVSDSTMKYGDAGICRQLVYTHEVVVVTIQYRLGYLGFFTTGDSACDDNVALWDMTKALQWVQTNIGTFGGNPGNVTLFGQSAGGAAVDLLSLSPYSRDLFHKVCPMAGSAGNEWAINTNAVEICRHKAAEVGVTASDSTEMIKQLRAVPAMKFATHLKLELQNAANLQTEIGPRFDGVFFPRPLAELRREVPPKPRLIGTCEYEGLVIQLFIDSKHLVAQKFHQMIAERIPESMPGFLDRRKDAWRGYFGNSENPTKDELNNGFAKLFSDVFLNIGTFRSANEVLSFEGEHPPPTYLYSFEYCNPKSWGLLGHKFPFKAATHCTELSYLFNVGVIWGFEFSEDDYKMMTIMTKYWCNFARYGNPNGHPDVPDSKPSVLWEPLSRENPGRHLKICLAPEMVDKYQEDRPLFWNWIASQPRAL